MKFENGDSDYQFGIKIACLPLMKTVLFLLLILIQTPLLAQLNRKVVKQEDGSIATKYFHKNGKVSTIETWDKDKRDGNLKGFNNQGKELFSLSLRHYGGHASALLSWYANGQVKSVSYSDAPDGGIQYYHSTRLFDEKGNQTSFTEDSYDDQLKLEVPVRDTTKPRKPLVEINQPLEKKAANYQLLMFIENKSIEKVSLVVKFSDGKKEESISMKLKPGESYLVDTWRFVPADFDAAKFFSINFTNRKCIVKRQPDQLLEGDDNLLKAIWFVTNK